MAHVSTATLCEYRRCGGLGRRETRKRWAARVTLTVSSATSSRDWHVCEGCANLLMVDARRDGFDVVRKQLGRPSTRRPRAPKPMRKRPAPARGRHGQSAPGQTRKAQIPETSGRQARLDDAMKEQRARDLARALELEELRRRGA